MNYYTICPTCGYKLLKAGEGTNIEIFCPKCGQKMTIDVKDDTIIVRKILSNKTQETT